MIKGIRKLIWCYKYETNKEGTKSDSCCGRVNDRPVIKLILEKVLRNSFITVYVAYLNTHCFRHTYILSRKIRIQSLLYPKSHIVRGASCCHKQYDILFVNKEFLMSFLSYCVSGYKKKRTQLEGIFKTSFEAGTDPRA